MKKSDAIQLLGGTIASAAAEVGSTYQAVGKWPELLPQRIEDRVVAAYARKCLRTGEVNEFWGHVRSNPRPTTNQQQEAMQ